MPVAPLPGFRLLSPAQFALLSAVEKSDYLGRWIADIKMYKRRFQEDNKRLVHWILHKDDRDGGR